MKVCPTVLCVKKSLITVAEYMKLFLSQSHISILLMHDKALWTISVGTDISAKVIIPHMPQLLKTTVCNCMPIIFSNVAMSRRGRKKVSVPGCIDVALEDSNKFRSHLTSHLTVKRKHLGRVAREKN